MYYLGIDPGVSGGMCLLDEYGTVACVGKFKDKTEHDIATLFKDYIKVGSYGTDGTSGNGFAIIEKVHSMPKQGVASTFKFGRSYGFLRGCLVCNNIPFEEIAPAKWQRELHCLSKGDKNVTKARAQQLFSSQVERITHYIADAMLLAEYARTMRKGGE